MIDYTWSPTISNPAIEALSSQLTPYITTLRRVVEQDGYGAPECSVNVPSDPYMLSAVEDIIDRVYSKSLRYIFVIGIGGSNLGTKAIYDAMAGSRDLAPHHHARLIFIDTVDGSLLATAQSLIRRSDSAGELLFIIISKSGNTTETVANAEILLNTFADRFGHNAKRVIVMSESGSPLLKAAIEQNMHTIPLPPQVGGRYSVFTPVGLLPLGLLGLPIREMREEAVQAVQKALHPDIILNTTARIALTYYYYYRLGVRQHDMFVDGPALESLGKWYRQLLAESVGKTTKVKNEKVGITPTVSVLSTDLHSVGQLYLGGPKERFTTFVEVLNTSVAIPIPKYRTFPDLVPAIDNKTSNAIAAAIISGTKSAYDNNQLPYIRAGLPQISAPAIASYMQTMMISTMFLGHLLDVDPFDQPHVEQYKSVTKKILEENSNMV